MAKELSILVGSDFFLNLDNIITKKPYFCLVKGSSFERYCVAASVGECNR